MDSCVQLKDWAAVEDVVARARNQGRLLTNFFADPVRMGEWCAVGALFALETPEVTFLGRRQSAFCSVYFFAADAASLRQALENDALMPFGTRVVVDVVGPDRLRQPIVDAFRASGFAQVSELVRMSRKTPENGTGGADSVQAAQIRDIPDIQAIFHAHFNPEVEQLPSDAELSRWIEQRAVLVHRDEQDKVQGFVIYDLSRASLYLRYWFVDPRLRGKGVGGALMRTMFFHAKDTKRQYFWVIADNSNAIVRYQHYGFQFEPMRDVVLAKDFQ